MNKVTLGSGKVLRWKMICRWIPLPFSDCLPLIVAEPGLWIKLQLSQRSYICMFPFLNVAHYFHIKQQILGRPLLLIITVNNIFQSRRKILEGIQVANWGASMIYSKWGTSSLFSLFTPAALNNLNKKIAKKMSWRHIKKMLSSGNIHKCVLYHLPYQIRIHSPNIKPLKPGLYYYSRK